MKRFKPSLSILAVFTLVLLSGCGDPPQPTQAEAQQSVTAGRKIWPPPVAGKASGTDSVALASTEVLADNWELVLDNSGSMETHNCSGADSRMVAGAKAVIAFSRKRPANDNFGLVLFHDGDSARVATPLGKNRAMFESEAAKARADQNTPLKPAINLGYFELEKQARRQGGYGTYHLVVVTDGDWNKGGDPVPLVRWIVENTPVQVHVVGFCTGEGHSLNIAGYTSYVSADNADQVNQALQAVLASESRQFSLDTQFVPK